MQKDKILSISQLVDYLTSEAPRRKEIIEEAIKPKPFKANTYKEAKSRLSKAIITGKTDDPFIDGHIAELADIQAKQVKDWQIQHTKLSAEALQGFKILAPKLDLGKFTVMPPSIAPNKVMIAGLTVNVSPEAVLKWVLENEVRVGALKLHLSKTKKLDKRRADFMGAILAMYAEAALPAIGIEHRECSMVLDVPGQAIHLAPKAKIRNRSTIISTCEEIVQRWP